MTQKENTIRLSITTNFIASGLKNKPTVAYLTTTGITSDNTICLNRVPNGKTDSTLTLGPAQGQKIVIEPVNGEIRFSDTLPYILENIPQTSCPDNISPYVRSATLQNVELHLTQDNGIEILNFNFGNLNLPTAFLDSTPKPVPKY